LLLGIGVALLAGPARAPAADQLFAADSFWNAPLPAQVDLDQTDLAAGLLAQVRAEEQSNTGPWINTSAYSTPLYIAAPNTTPQRVKMDAGAFLGSLVHNNLDPTLNAALGAVPIPPGARPAAGTDGTLNVWQPSTDTLWELSRASAQADGWHAFWGGRIQDVSTSPA
jgi:hypothetical protein